jgi:hypothetical protein
MTPRRRRIRPAFMEKLQMLKFSIRKEKELDFTDALRWAEELMELEQIQKDAAPSDPFAYQRSLQVVDDDGDLDWEDEDPADDNGGDTGAMAPREGAEGVQLGGGDNDDALEYFDIYIPEGEEDDDDDELEGLYADD